jgi:hypothetical protein
MAFHQSTVAVWLQMAVLSSEKAESVTLLPLLPNKCETYFVNFSTVHLGSVPWQEEAIGDVQKFKVFIRVGTHL